MALVALKEDGSVVTLGGSGGDSSGVSGALQSGVRQIFHLWCLCRPEGGRSVVTWEFR